MKFLRAWIDSGSPWVWLSAGAVSLCLVGVFGLLYLIAVNGLTHFWPARIAEIDYRDADGARQILIGEMVDRELKTDAERAAGGEAQVLMKLGNRDIYGLDFRWVSERGIIHMEYPREIIAVEREEWGNLYGYLAGVEEGGRRVVSARDPIAELGARLGRRHELKARISHIEKDLIGGVNHEMEKLRLRQRRLELDGVKDPALFAAIRDSQKALEAEYERLNGDLAKLNEDINRDGIVVRVAGGQEVKLPVAKVIRVYQPNRMSAAEKLGHYVEKIGEFVGDDPREANTEGGIFPAIFGTVLMVLIMAVVVTPFGVVAAVYLREYAKQGLFTRIIRIAVNNLAGVPSIVYGVFGLGFFVYFVGGSIDRWFFPEALPAPTFGTGGLLWCSVTLALLTVPVVIVATEEGLARIPSAFREGSYALGATKAETLWRIVLPMASPAIMTGLILAVARAAGEVAPLMMVGVVKLAPSLGLDGSFPYLHLERKIMHLGFHIYDVGFQSPNVEAARPLVYATALLLVLVIVALNLTAIRIRNRLREKYRAAEY
ncbi:MAG: phosphate ABC transporter permease PstA [Gammaproteobacteria bacterium]